MQIRQACVSSLAALPAAAAPLAALNPDWVLVFAAPALLSEPGCFAALRQSFPGAVLLGCSTAGEISARGVDDATLNMTAVSWQYGRPVLASTRLDGMDDSEAAGQRLATQLASSRPAGVLVFGQGVNINGSALVAGLTTGLPPETPIMGGLAGDGAAFARTWVLDNDGVHDDVVVAMALPAGLCIGHGSFGGWKPFGPARRVTRCAGNVLFELDGEPALEVYKRYLGEHAASLPASGLLFPFEMLGHDHNVLGLVRTILAVDESAGSLVLAGDIEQDGYLRLMHASTDALVDGAEAAANAAHAMNQAPGDALAILVSCVGRKLVMGGRIDEEVEAVGDVLGQKAVLAGFYSYGEISPFLQTTECRLHNQTMTISLVSDAGA
ncbi:FIST signal transduction protein [Chitinilyticum piscinae]|uniref:FIST C-terminal domain-containing protein n=1 Tax=Chitinilyticum piscinae TaxID=2866724 RepID=A0A8J7KBK0_9NEIS|nr:FIST N-terminal domain-containing protein [Chitinilyticum piscinae]MBE9610309.1 FIST C-terminal domain-containing protein [Chitinilyticum piscinae]